MSTEIESNGHGQIYGLMAQILADVESIGKGRSNEQQGYKFRGIDDVYNMVHPLMSRHQVFCVPRMLAQDTSERVTATGTTLRFVQLSMAYDFFAPDGSHVTAEVMGEAMDSGDKASNKAMSAAHKYALLQTFCIPTGDVPDADYTTHPEVTGERKQVSKSSSAPMKCPDCGGAMWDNRETKKGKQPDYKCKDKSCNKAVWLPKEDAGDASSWGTDGALRDSLMDQAEKLMSKLPEDTRKDALGRLAMLDTEAMGQKVNELAENAKKKAASLIPPSESNLQESERQKRITDIVKYAMQDDVDSYLAEHHPDKTLNDLSLDALNEIYENCKVPF
jgi:hypothetical protein